MTIDVKPVSRALGAQVRGIDLAQELSRPQIEELTQLLLQHQVLFFRGQPLTPLQQANFAARFGTLHIHPIYPVLPDLPEIMLLDTHPGFLPDNDNWHTDVTFSATPPMAGILAAKHLPSTGGDTLWSSSSAAYEALSAPMRRLLDGLTATHSVAKSFPAERWAGEKALPACAAAAAIAMPLALGFLGGSKARAGAADPQAAPSSMTINFKDAPLDQVARAVATATHRTLVIDPRIHRRMNLKSQMPVTPEAFYQIFLSMLSAHGCLAVSAADGHTQISASPGSDALADSAGGGADDLLTQAVAVTNVSAVKIVTALRPLIPSSGQIDAYSASNIVIVSDSAGNVDRIAKIISGIDRIDAPAP